MSVSFCTLILEYILYMHSVVSFQAEEIVFGTNASLTPQECWVDLGDGHLTVRVVLPGEQLLDAEPVDVPFGKPSPLSQWSGSCKPISLTRKVMSYKTANHSLCRYYKCMITLITMFRVPMNWVVGTRNQNLAYLTLTVREVHVVWGCRSFT
jgi:hypothetical protein